MYVGTNYGYTYPTYAYLHDIHVMYMCTHTYSNRYRYLYRNSNELSFIEQHHYLFMHNMQTSMHIPNLPYQYVFVERHNFDVGDMHTGTLKI